MGNGAQPMERISGHLRHDDADRRALDREPRQLGADGEQLDRRSRSSEVGGAGRGIPALPLTARELDVVRALALGLQNKEIALRLGMSERTVKFHVGSI